MSNTYFNFKQFTVHQDKCAMKVCTDACLFGAWIVAQLQKPEVENVLDIGTGTGLLTLMLAQKMNANIDAVELDEQAALQAEENFKASPWNERITVHHTSIQKFEAQHKYDVVISNPPFFQNSLQSELALKNIAKHATALSFSVLAEVVYSLLHSGGKFGVLLPYQEFKHFEEIAAGKNLHLEELVNVQQTPTHSYFRSMAIFARDNTPGGVPKSITIKDKANQYTSEFITLLKDYYLYL